MTTVLGRRGVPVGGAVRVDVGGLGGDGGLGKPLRHPILGALYCLMGLGLDQVRREPESQHEAREPAEARELCPRPPHVENGASLGGGAGADGALVFGRGDEGHAGQPVGTAGAYRNHRVGDAGEHLAGAVHLDPGLHYVADAGHPRPLAGTHDVEPGGKDPGVP